jgi:hypothetical protein
MSGYASRATSYIPAAASGRSAQLTIVIPSGATTSGEAIEVRSSTSREFRPTSANPRRSVQRSDASSTSLTGPIKSE